MDEVLDKKVYEKITIEVVTETNVASGINGSGSKENLLKDLAEHSKDGSAPNKEFLNSLKAKGKAIDNSVIPEGVSQNEAIAGWSNAFTGPNNAPNAEVQGIFDARQNTNLQKNEKIVLSEELAEARVDQILTEQNCTRLDIDSPNATPPYSYSVGNGKTGLFDRIYEAPDGTIYLVEAKGGGSTLGSRVDGNGSRNQQGTVEYRDDIIEQLKKKLGENHPLVQKIDDAIEDEIPIEYILIKQSASDVNDVIVKKFPP